MADTIPPAPGEGEELFRLLEAAQGGRPIFESIADLSNRRKIEEATRRAVERVRLEIPKIWRTLPSCYQKLIEGIAHDENADLYDVAAEWFVQRMLFREIGEHFKLEEAERFPGTRPECVIVLTQTGSFVSAGQRDPVTGERDVEYIRIPTRRNNWKGNVTFRTSMRDLAVGERAGFNNEITTSPVQCILVVPLGKSHELARIVESTTRAVGSTVLPRRERTPDRRRS